MNREELESAMRTMTENVLPNLAVDAFDVRTAMGWEDDIDEMYVKVVLTSLSKIVRANPERNTAKYLLGVLNDYKTARSQML